jgi:hypothetical protein
VTCNQYGLAVLVVAFMAIFLRFYYIDHFEFWYDEAFNVLAANRNLHPPTFPPVYFWLLSLWIKYAGNTEAILRLPSALFSLLTIPVFYRMVRIVLNRWQSLLGALMVTLAPFHIWYAHEVAPYSISLFCMSLVYYFYLKVIYQKKNKYIFFAILMTLISLSIDYFSLIIVLPLISCLIVYLISNRKKILALSFLLCLLGMGLIVLDLLKYVEESVRWINYAIDPFIILSNLLLGYTFDVPTSYVAYLSIIVVVAFISRSLIVNREWRLICIIILPIIVSYFFSFFIFPVVVSRKFIGLSIPIFFALTFSAFRQKSLTGRMLFVFILLIMTYFNVHLFNKPISFQQSTASNDFHRGLYYKYPHKKIFGYLLNNVKRDDVVLYTNTMLRPLIKYHLFKHDYYYKNYLALLAEELTYEENDFLLESLVVRMDETIDKLNKANLKIRSRRPIDADLFYHNMDILGRVGRYAITQRQMNEIDKKVRQKISEYKLRWNEYYDYSFLYVFLDQGGLEILNAKQYFLLTSSWDRSLGLLDERNMKIRRWMFDHLKREKTLLIDGIIIDVFSSNDF